MNNISMVSHYRKKVCLTAVVILLLFWSIYFLQGKMWHFENKYKNSLKEIVKLEKELTEVSIRKTELEGLIELLEQQPCKGNR